MGHWSSLISSCVPSGIIENWYLDVVGGCTLLHSGLKPEEMAYLTLISANDDTTVHDLSKTIRSLMLPQKC